MDKRTILIAFLLLWCMSGYTTQVKKPLPSLIPYPQHVERGNGQFELSAQTRLVLEDQGLFWKEAAYLQSLLAPVLGQGLSSNSGVNSIVLVYSDQIEAEEAYQLDITSSQISLKARTPQGLFYGIQTLRQLLPYYMEEGEKIDYPIYLPVLSITDEPAFSWRGSMIDVSRHFFTLDYLKKHIDRLALYKMNKLHLHLTDDQGWRVEIKKYPELTSQGAWRTYNNQDSLCMELAKENPAFEIDPRHIIKKEGKELYGGYYTQDQLRDLVAYAASRHVEIIPEIDMPGHMLAAISAYPNLVDEKEIGWGKLFTIPLCPCKEEVYTFVEDVLSEIMEIFPSQYIHIGADEVEKDTWEKSENCRQLMERENIETVDKLQSYFVHRVQQFIESKGRKVIGWDEILDGGISSDVYVMYWRDWVSKVPSQAIENGNNVITSSSNPLYFNRPPDKNSLHTVYHFDVIYKGIPAGKETLMKGAQANMWSERIPTEQRADFLLFPRMTALAERLWTNKDLYDSYSDRLLDHCPRLDALGINYRLLDLTGFAAESVFVKETFFQVNNPHPEMSVYYTTDGTLPDRKSILLENPLKITQPVELKFALFRPNGIRGDVYTVNYRPARMAKGAKLDKKELNPGLRCGLYMDKVRSTKDIKSGALKEQIVPEIIVPEEFITSSFALKYKGYIKIPQTGIYTFYLTCDDGGVLYINNEITVDNDGFHSAIEKSGQAALSEGYHPFQLDFIEGGGGFTLKLQYSFNGSEPQDIPDSWFVHSSKL